MSNTLIDTCRKIETVYEIQPPYHICAVFETNDSYEISGWVILDENNNIITDVIKNLNDVKNWKNYIKHGEN